MEKKYKIFFKSFPVMFSCFVSLIIWKYIELPYSYNNIEGIYSQNQYNYLNDFVRYFVFLLIPFLTFFLTKFFIHKDNFYILIKNFFTQDIPTNIDIKKNNLQIFFLILFFVYLIFEFLSIDFPRYKIDSYHDGQMLSSAYKSFLDGSLWSGSYITRGIIFETLSSKLIWQFFNHTSIGLARYVEIINILLLKISLIFLIYIISRALNFETNKKILYFLLCSIFFLKLTDYDKTTVDALSYRELPVICLLILFVLKQQFKSKNFILFLISFISLFSILWGIDRGIVCNLLIILILIELAIQKQFKYLFNTLFFLIFFWLGFYFISPLEFKHFLSNTISIINDMSHIFGIIHPVPFSNDENSMRATKTLILILLSLIISLSLIFKKNNIENKNFDKFLFFLGIVCSLSYIHALGRSDGPHIKSTIGFPLFFFILIFIKILFEKISNLKYLVILFFVLSLNSLFKINFYNIKNFSNRLSNFIYLKDEFFLDDKLKKRLEVIKRLEIKEYCVDIFTYDAAILYLIRKPSCTKYYYSYSLGSLNNQNKFIARLSELDKSIIITNGLLDYWDPIKKKYNKVYKYIIKNYYIYDDQGYLIFKKFKI
jgi:hypothetical protein